MMNEYKDRLSDKLGSSATAIAVQWRKRCDHYLPVALPDSIWSYSRKMLGTDPEQGWKLHIAATILTAGRVLEAVGPLLTSCGVLFKAPVSLAELDKLNSGIFYGYSQVGKFLTVYPRSTEEAVGLASKIHRLTRRLAGAAPTIPFDSKYRPDGCVYYRYGGFKDLALETNDERIDAIRDPKGNLIPDIRDSSAKPDWIADLFTDEGALEEAKQTPTPLQTTFKAFRALAQRGRGGVYQAFDLSVTPSRLCILKEGRKNGEVDWEGRDGFWRVRHEERVLALLRDAGVSVPSVYSSFKADKNYFIAMEFIEGEDLNSWLARKQRRISVASALKRGAELARIVSSIHAAGWVWRDCKPRNMVITKSGELRPLDFEGACPVDRPDRLPWGTTSYFAPEASDPFQGQSRLPEDLYALGAVIYLLLAGRTPDTSPSLPLSKVRKNLPSGVYRLVAELLNLDPRCRPEARSVARRIESLYLEISQRRHGVRLARRANSTNLGSPRRSSYMGSVVRKTMDANRSS